MRSILTRIMHRLFVLAIGSCVLWACGAKTATVSADSGENAPLLETFFNGDTAYAFTQQQVEFGPRVPGSADHDACAAWIETKLARLTDTVIVQNGTVMAFDGNKLPVKNIFGRLNPEKGQRILLLAHYDTRPWADADDNEENFNTPIAGANDGASGVAVVLELARALRQARYEGGIDFLLVDAEDYGKPEHLSGAFENTENTWCLGTQYWIENGPVSRGDKPVFAILFDMVGSKDAKFHREFYSDTYARQINDLIWNAAGAAGYSHFFVDGRGNPITDDHIHFLKAGIPAVDIIENNNPTTGTFNPTWHTLQDDMKNIDANTLQAVGKTVETVIRNIK